MAKTYRIRSQAVEELKDKRISLIVETKDEVRESDIIHTLIWKYLECLSAKDVEKYREEVLEKD